MRYTILATFASLGVLAPSVSHAQGGQTSALVLELPSSTRALALGGAYVAAGVDDAALFYNPSQLATLEGRAASMSVQPYIEGSTLGAISGAFQLGPGTVGIGVQVLSYGSIDEFVCDETTGCERGDATGRTVSANEVAALVGYGMTWRMLRIGGAAKYVRQSLADASGGAPALDVGAAIDVWRGATIGVSIQNVGPGLKTAGSSAPLPRLLRVGASLPWRGVGPFDVLGTVEVAQHRDGDPLPLGGAEVTWTSANGLAFSGRVGALARAENSATSRMSFGGGVRARHFALDYAYQSFDALALTTHRFGLRWWR
ncbi:MAG TPA: PorV/PorQ family protein [Gemmatimonadaceae bacterium]|nr:PorV/PorQ family protein [Gemmatimonadaceae bacterium]